MQTVKTVRPARRGMRPALAAILFAGVWSAAAFAHAMMTGSVPKDGATVGPGVSEISMEFSRAMRLTVVGIVRMGDQKAMALAGGLPASFGKVVKVAVEPLPEGAYKVTWTAVAADGHVMNGGFAFTVGGTPATQPKQ